MRPWLPSPLPGLLLLPISLAYAKSGLEWVNLFVRTRTHSNSAILTYGWHTGSLGPQVKRLMALEE